MTPPNDAVPSGSDPAGSRGGSPPRPEPQPPARSSRGGSSFPVRYVRRTGRPRRRRGPGWIATTLLAFLPAGALAALLHPTVQELAGLPLGGWPALAPAPGGDARDDALARLAARVEALERAPSPAGGRASEAPADERPSGEGRRANDRERTAASDPGPAEATGRVRADGAPSAAAPPPGASAPEVGFRRSPRADSRSRRPTDGAARGDGGERAKSPREPHGSRAPEDGADALARLRARGQGALELDVAGETLAFELVFVPAGTGRVGMDPDDPELPNRAARALFPTTSFSSPGVRVRVDEGFFLGATEVTNRQYLALLRASGGDRGSLAHLEQLEPGWEDEPVRNVSWADAAAACRALTRALREQTAASDAVVRLPSELEWELAAAGPGERPRRFPWGDDPAPARELSGALGPVGARPADATPGGIHDLAGSVSEWCLDRWRPHRWEEAPATGLRVVPSALEMPEPSAADPMACRGGAAASPSPMHLECASRRGRLAGTRSRALGFRILVTAGARDR